MHQRISCRQSDLGSSRVHGFQKYMSAKVSRGGGEGVSTGPAAYTCIDQLIQGYIVDIRFKALLHTYFDYNSCEGSSVGLLVISRWLWPGNRTFLEVASMLITWWTVTFLWCKDHITAAYSLWTVNSFMSLGQHIWDEACDVTIIMSRMPFLALCHFTFRHDYTKDVGCY